MSCFVVQESVNSITIKVLDADIDKKQITRLNRARHAVSADVDDADLFLLSSVEHLARIFN